MIGKTAGLRRIIRQVVEAIFLMALAILFWVIVFDGILLEQARHDQKPNQIERRTE